MIDEGVVTGIMSSHVVNSQLDDSMLPATLSKKTLTTVLREFSGLPIEIPKAKRIEKLKSRRHTSHIWISKEGLISIEDRLFNMENIRNIIYDKRVADPQIVISLKADESARMELVSGIHNELRKADALKLNYSTKTSLD